MEIPKRLRDLAISASGFVFDPYSGSTFTANGTALTILLNLREGKPQEQISAVLHEQYETEGQDVGYDVRSFVASLEKLGILPAEQHQGSENEDEH